MPEWATFVGVSSVVTLLLLALSRATETALTDSAVTSSDADGSSDDVLDERSREALDARSRNGRDDSNEPGTSDAGTDDSEPFLPDRGTAVDEDGVPRSERDATVEPGTDDGSSAADETGAEASDGAGSEASTAAPSSVPQAAARWEPEPGDRSPDGFPDGSPASRTLADSMSTGELLANVALSQGVFAVLLVGTAVYAAIPADALGIAFTREFFVTGLALGTAFGLALYVANELGSAAATRLGFDHDEELRGLLAPDDLAGWLVLLGLVLPLVAGFEELLFRGALIGATAAGYGVSPWLLAVVSSVAFALGHGMQGSVGVVVTGLLGFVLAAGFVLTESLLVVIVAHYLINALEFVVHEGLELEWTDPAGR